ncbi:MAG: hypothetical protein IID17_02330 [Nitrospinae bacterium]|nr:hypothetical protein [Nitrospinota bacterium]
MTITQSSPESGMDFNLSLNDELYQSKASIRYRKISGKTYLTWAVKNKRCRSKFEAGFNCCRKSFCDGALG